MMSSTEKMRGTGIASRVLYEDNHLIVINKLPSEIIQGDKTGDQPLGERVKDYIKKKYHKPGKVFLGVTHRLDRPVSGTVIFARTSKALTRLNAMLKDRQIDKKYWALVQARPPSDSGKLLQFLKKNESRNKSYVVAEGTPGAKRAELTYRLIGESNRYYLLEVLLMTGRHHQIRTQLASISCPIKGDVKYGFDRPNKDGSIHLHARSVQMVHPVKQENIEVIAPLPPQDPLWQFFDQTV
ncbi:MAG: RluA family pseudouridine synthase [Bacteroidales bacterium]